MNQDITDAIVIIGNNKAVIEMCEPNIVEPMKLKDWMVVRTLTAVALFEDEVKKREKE